MQEVSLWNGCTGKGFVSDDMAGRQNFLKYRFFVHGGFHRDSCFSGSNQWSFVRLAGQGADVVYRYSAEYSGTSSAAFMAGHPGAEWGTGAVPCHRKRKLDADGKGGTDAGAAVQGGRVYSGGKIHGGRFLSYFPETFDAKHCFFYYVYGSYEYPECNAVRGNLKFYGNRAVTGTDFLGKYALHGAAGIFYRFLVGDCGSGCLSGGDALLYYKYWKYLSEGSQFKTQ